VLLRSRSSTCCCPLCRVPREHRPAPAPAPAPAHVRCGRARVRPLVVQPCDLRCQTSSQARSNCFLTLSAVSDGVRNGPRSLGLTNRVVSMHELSCLFPEENVMPFHPDQPAHRRRPPAVVGSAPENLVPVEATPRLYTPKDAAALLRVRESWLRREAAARTIAVTFLGRHLRFSAANLASIIAAGSQPSGSRRGSRKRRPAITRKATPNGNPAAGRDLTIAPERSVHASRPDDPVPDGSSRWPG
jgi:hypothetical protein